MTLHMSLHRQRYWLPFMAVLALFVLAACSSPTPAQPTTQTIVPTASAGPVAGTAHSGTPGTDATAPAAQVTGAATIIPGGSAIFNVEAAEAFTQLFLWLEGFDGYYEFTVPATTSQQVTVNLSANLQALAYAFRFAVGTGSGAGAAAEQDAAVERVGTGDLQISVSWDTAADVDLYLVEPDGTEIFYVAPESSSGGVLDLDSNADCSPPDLRNENITYDGVTPPSGEYTVRVNYWSACGAASTNYVVTVRIAGQATQSFQGTFTGDGVGGAAGAGEVITTFTIP